MRLRPPPVNPVLAQHAQERRKRLENRLADRITRFAGSMKFVYLHLIWFGSWIGFRLEHYPFGLLTMIVSLEAIFLSTFVMISQNRADERRQALADQEWQTVQDEAQQNNALLDLSHHILAVAEEIQANTAVLSAPAGVTAGPRTPEDATAAPEGARAGSSALSPARRAVPATPGAATSSGETEEMNSRE